MSTATELFKENLFLRAFGWFKVPLLFWLRPKLIEATSEKVVIRIKLGRRTKNHLNSMYFGVLCAGADLAGGFLAMRIIEKGRRAGGPKVALVFKDFKADFLKRAEGDVDFTCTDGAAVRKLVEQAISSGERMEMPVQVIATVPKKLGNEPVAQFSLTLSLKKR